MYLFKFGSKPCKGCRTRPLDRCVALITGVARSELENELHYEPRTLEAEVEKESILTRLKRDNEITRSTFWDKMKFWEATKPRAEDIEEQLRVRAKVINKFKILKG